MKRKALLLMLLTLTAALQARTFRFGGELALGTAIGTGKGYWDWTDKSEETLRNPFVFNGGGSILILADLSPLFQLETGVGYFVNRCKIENDGVTLIYRQDSLDIPLGLKMFFSRDKKGLYVKGAAALMILTDSASFADEDGDDDLFASSVPGQRYHAGLITGMGYQKETAYGLWQLEARYANFYTSPDYKREEGTLGDVRYHRIQMAVGWFY